MRTSRTLSGLGQIKLLQKCFSPILTLSFSHSKEGAAESKVIKAVHFVIKIALIRNNAHNRLRLFDVLHRIDPINFNGTVGRSCKTNHHIDSGGFPCAVRAEEAKYFALANGKRDAIYRFL